MFERFTDGCRRVLVLAQEQARLLGHNFIGTEHILLGLLAEREGVAAKALGSLGVGLDAARDKVAQMVGPAASPRTGSPPFTPRAKRVLELALREALQLGHNYIGTEHLLLGVVREGEGVAAQVLAGLGADPGRVRQRVLALLSGQPSPEAGEEEPAAPLTERRDGPRCPSCRVLLDGRVGYRVLSVPSADQDQPGDAIAVVFVHCLRCGVVIAHTPDDPGRPLPSTVTAPIDLTRQGRLLDGTVNGGATHLDFGERSHDMTVRGTFAGAALEAHVSYDSNYQRPTGLTARLTGSLDDQEADLAFAYDLEPSYRFARGEITGTIAGRTLTATATVTPASDSTGAVSVAGRWGSDEIQLSASVSGDLGRGHIQGTVGETAVDVSARRTDVAAPHPRQTLRLTGTWDGPVAILALAAGTLVELM